MSHIKAPVIYNHNNEQLYSIVNIFGMGHLIILDLGVSIMGLPA